MATLSALLGWRQGSLLKSDELHHLQVDATQFVAIVISHDCDIPADAEGVIEILICKRLEKEDKLFCNSRNVRKLHLPYSLDAGEVYFELSFQKRVLVPRADFARNFTEPDHRYRLSSSDKRVLKQWLAVRYGRPAYPNAFEARLRVKMGKDNLERKLAKLVEAKVANLVGIWVDLDTDKESELPPEDAYFLKMFLVYKTDGNLHEARVETETLATDILELFGKAFTGEEHLIVLDTCHAVADTSFSLVDIMRTDQWRVEHISLSANDDSFVATGE